MILYSHNDGRAAGRTSIENGALLFFKGQVGARGCKVIDISDNGTRLRTQFIGAAKQLRPDFGNFLTIRWCRLIWRDGDFHGVA
jgi:hypothetical protein